MNETPNDPPPMPMGMVNTSAKALATSRKKNTCSIVIGSAVIRAVLSFYGADPLSGGSAVVFN